MNYEELLSVASSLSDHGKRVTEIEPSIKEALSTPSEYPFLEIGNREGGSAILTMWYVAQENKRRGFETCDVSEQSRNIAEYVQKFDINYLGHNKQPQFDFVRHNERIYGFIYLDAEHGYEKVKDDLNILKEFVCSGGIIAIDDVEDWPDLPYIEGMELVLYNVDQGEKVS